MPRLVRQAPLLERIKAYLDPYDFLLWLSEELNDNALEDWLKEWATPIGLSLNILFVVARGASKAGSAVRGRDDVFGDLDGGRGSGWFSWFAAFLVNFLTLVCCVNAFYTFLRKRHYRLFEQPVDISPATPSASRVRVDSSPLSSSPLRYLHALYASATNPAASRAYPDAEREVWEVSLWDPKPAHLTLFTLFSPGHLLLYYSLLPPSKLDPRPSVTVLSALAYSCLLSLQLGMLRTAFSQQAKDSALIHGEVLNEYDTKFVRPALQRPVRDVGTQTRESTLTPRGTRTREVDVYTPTTIVNRGFRTHPNPNYARQYDPENLLATPAEHTRRPQRQNHGSTADGEHSRSMSTTTNLFQTPSAVNTSSYPTATTNGNLTASTNHDFSSPLKPHHERLRARTPAKGDGGSMGVYSHAASPLKKRGAVAESLRDRGVSPVKRASMPSAVGRANLNGWGGGRESMVEERRERGRH